MEQVNFAVSNVTQTTKEAETSSTQTLATASQLAELSARLRRIIEPVPGIHPVTGSHPATGGHPVAAGRYSPGRDDEEESTEP